MVEALLVGSITLATKDASNTYQIEYHPIGFWVVFGIYALAAATAVTLGTLGLRQKDL